MASSPTTEKVIPYALLGMTAVTGLVDAVRFLSRLVVSGLSIARSLTALLAFLVGAILGGRIVARASSVVSVCAYVR
jgi:hypothetical protein